MEKQYGPGCQSQRKTPGIYPYFPAAGIVNAKKVS